MARRLMSSRELDAKRASAVSPTELEAMKAAREANKAPATVDPALLPLAYRPLLDKERLRGIGGPEE